MKLVCETEGRQFPPKTAFDWRMKRLGLGLPSGVCSTTLSMEAFKTWNASLTLLSSSEEGLHSGACSTIIVVYLFAALQIVTCEFTRRTLPRGLFENGRHPGE